MDGRLSPLPEISVELYGEIAADVAQAVRGEVESCFRALPGPLPAGVVLGLYDTLARWREYAARRREEAGVVTAGEEGFLATHDAWEGLPRLNVCLERLRAQPWLLQQGALHQVVAHSVLHGRPECYRFAVPRALIDTCESRGLELAVLQQLLYFVASAVKGHAAVSLLVQHGFVHDQVALARYQAEARADEVALWRMARWEPRARLLYLAAQLRPLLYLRPLLPHAPELEQAGRDLLAHLPVEVGERLHLLVGTLAAHASGDLHRDVGAGLQMVLSWL